MKKVLTIIILTSRFYSAHCMKKLNISSIPLNPPQEKRIVDERDAPHTTSNKRIRTICRETKTEDGIIVAGYNDGSICIFDKDGNQLAQCNGHGDWITSLCIIPVKAKNPWRIISGSADRTIRIWTMNGKQLRCIDHLGFVRSVSVTKTKDGRRIISQTNDGTIYTWDFNGIQYSVQHPY